MYKCKSKIAKWDTSLEWCTINGGISLRNFLVFDKITNQLTSVRCRFLLVSMYDRIGIEFENFSTKIYEIFPENIFENTTEAKLIVWGNLFWIKIRLIDGIACHMWTGSNSIIIFYSQKNKSTKELDKEHQPNCCSLLVLLKKKSN